MKRSFLESAFEEKYEMISFYLVIELTNMIVKILRAEALSILDVSFRIIVGIALVAVVDEVESIFFSSDSVYEKEIDNSHIVSLVLK